MDRRRFLRAFSTTAAGLLVAPDALELLVEPRRRYWPGWGPGAGSEGEVCVADFSKFLSEIYEPIVHEHLRLQSAVLQMLRHDLSRDTAIPAAGKSFSFSTDLRYGR